MDRDRERRYLAQAEDHVASGERIVERQRGILARLKRDGRDTRVAQVLLHTYERLLKLQIERRDSLRRRLGCEDEEAPAPRR